MAFEQRCILVKHLALSAWYRPLAVVIQLFQLLYLSLLAFYIAIEH